MLHLTLRQEFRGRRLKGTAIELTNASNTGATQIAAADFLQITYPSADALTAIEAVGARHGRPLVLIGERGQGKSHLMAMLYHTFTAPEAARSWLATWADRLGNTKLAELPLHGGMHVISESLHRQSYRFLWDLLFDRHPHGPEVRGMWKGRGDRKTDVPSYDLLLELFRHTPTALVLDEFQTWYDGLTNTRQYPWRTWAFNFVQLLSEIAKEHPDLLVLVVSVRNGDTDAFQQIQRVGPILVDFKGPTARQDRQKLLLHRLFENRMQVANAQIEEAIGVHVSEYLRLAQASPAEHDLIRREFVQCWPYGPHLMRLLEDQVLVATQAQETRDLIRILADLFKRQGDRPVITAADFRLDDERNGIAALLDSVSNQHHANLRDKAQRNLSAVLEAVRNPADVPHLAEIVGALWLRSLAVGNLAGAEPAALQIDITRGAPIDDNAFQVELATIVENSFNIHQAGTRLVFREEENPQAKLIASARNDKLFEDRADIAQLAREARYVIGGQEAVSQAFRVVVLPEQWSTAPWESVADGDQPSNWDERLPLLVLPASPDEPGPTLGPWLRDHLQARRNAVRFLLPRAGSTSLFRDRDLLILARAVVLADRWRTQAPEYRRLQVKYEREMRDILGRRFDRFAILDTWDYREPVRCTLHVESHKAQGAKIPEAVDEHIRANLFIPEDFGALVRVAADSGESVGKLLRELQEPRPARESCIPWLGETPMKERIIRLCARGEVAINVRDMEHLQAGAQDLDGFSLEDYQPFTNVAAGFDRVVRFLCAALAEQGRSVKRVDENSYAIPCADGDSVIRFTTDRELAREQEGIDLMGLDHPLMSEALQHWQSVAAEEFGVAVTGDDDPAVLSRWLIRTEGRNGEHRSFIQPLAVSAEGGRVPTLERKGIDLLRRQPGPATLSLGQRRELLHDIIEPMVQRELNHRGLVPENGGYSAKLIGWVEVGEWERS